ncbi:MAG: hypothetical protein LUG14_06350 [Synergistaceae bacterium]|uniref:hypothetical protein n=1 Tax=Cloacibacillus sp. TaxID=2049023 RepID=UPI0025C57C23|nr:hypothetical protein [Cloacibacillus sp.]MCC8058546.1 hypothetical protein [Cloacibacillus sp.]MCD7952531.1 hypothetical protein [Synergistaceae bacterium]
MKNIAQPVLPDGGIFRFHMAVEGRGEHLQKGNRSVFLNIRKVIYGERCESDKNDAARRHGRRRIIFMLLPWQEDKPGVKSPVFIYNIQRIIIKEEILWLKKWNSKARLNRSWS